MQKYCTGEIVSCVAEHLGDPIALHISTGVWENSVGLFLA